MKTRHATTAAIGCAALLAALHAAASLGNPVGLIEDDSIQVMLARSLSRGAFALPDAGGVPISDPLPGLALILLAPVRLLDPHWGPLRAVALFSLAAAAFFAFRIGRRLLPEPWPALAAGLTLLTPALVRHAGLVLPDLPFLALAMAALDLATLNGPLQALGIAAAALAAMVRPQGAFLVLALALGLWRDPRRRKTGQRGLLALAALLPLGLWLARNKLVAGVSTGFALNWRTQVSLLAEPGAQLRHGLAIVASFFGYGMAGIGSSRILGLSAGIAILAMAALGAARLLRDRKDESVLIFSLSAYASMILALHLTWAPEDSRYVIPLVCVAWLFAAACASRLRLGQAALAAIALTCLWRDAGFVSASLRRNRSYQPDTMSWLAAHAPADARIESLKYNTVRLLTGLPALPPPLHVRDREGWYAEARRNGVSFLHVEEVFRPGGFIPQGAGLVGANIARWARETPEARLAYSSPEEGAIVFDLRRPPEPVKRRGRTGARTNTP